MATVSRSAELVRLLASIGAQEGVRARVIIVDQNDDDRITHVLDTISAPPEILHLRSTRGLSRARNVGLAHISADVVAFPDDDCWYDPTLLLDVAEFLHRHSGVDGLSVALVDESGAPSGGRWDSGAGAIDRRNVWRRATSSTVFLRRALVEATGRFDQSLGVGSGTPFGSGEETDYLLRAMRQGFTLWYDSALAVFHSQSDIRRVAAGAGWSFGMGMGRVLRKHGYLPTTAAYHAARAAGGAALALGTGRRSEAGFHWAVAGGRLRGYLAR